LEIEERTFVISLDYANKDFTSYITTVDENRDIAMSDSTRTDTDIDELVYFVANKVVEEKPERIVFSNFAIHYGFYMKVKRTLSDSGIDVLNDGMVKFQ